MYSFYNPSMLYGLFAALIPLAIHLFNRRRAVTLPFSNVALLQSLQQDRMRRVRLRQILLLILRTLLILLLVIAFARPAVQGSGMGADVPTAAALVLDRSLSMRHASGAGETLFDAARKQLTEALDTFSARDEIAVFLVDDRTEVLDVPGWEQLKHRVGALTAGYRTTDMERAVREAGEWLGSRRSPNRELFLFTDGAQHGWAEGDSIEVERLTLFLALHRPDQSDNVSIVGVQASGQLLIPGTPATLQVDLRNHGTGPREGISLVVDAAGTRVAQESVSLSGGEERRIYLRMTPDRGGPMAISVDIGADDLPEDSRFTTFIHVPDSLRVLLAGPRGPATYYLEQALKTVGGSSGRVSLNTVSGSLLTPSDLAGFGSIWLSNVARLPDPLLDALRREVEAGVGLVLFLGDAVDMRHYNKRLLSTLIPSRLIAVSGSPIRAERPRAFRSFRLPFPDHPLFTGLAPDAGFESPKFYAHYRVRLSDPTRPLLAFSDGFPAISEAPLGRGRVVLVASAMDLSWSELPVSGMLVPFVERLARYLAQNAFGGANHTVGDRVFREITDARPREALLRPPYGDPRTIWPEQQGSRSVWRVGEVDAPGLWEITAGGRSADRFAVQLDPAESDMTPVSLDALKQRLPSARIEILANNGRTAESIRQTRYGKELWRSVLAAALVLALAEMGIALSVRTTRGRENS